MELNVLHHQNNFIAKVFPQSIAEEMDIEPGDILIAVNGNPVRDIIDYLFLITDEYVEIDIRKKNGDLWTLEIEKDPDEDLGLEFVHPIMDHARNCQNKCVFCFIDQLPQGMRPTLYFKDDDSRLSFLQGNFVTLTNVSDEAFQRIIDYNISPINVSIHTTNPKLRIRMLGNKRAGNILERLERLAENRVRMNGQIVLCPGLNDGVELDRTLKDIDEIGEGLESIAVVPIGLTKHRKGLARIDSYTKDSSNLVIDQVEAWQRRFLEKRGSRFVFLSDEFYVMANRERPLSDEYEGFSQIENGVGLMTKLEQELLLELSKKKSMKKRRHVSLVTGTSAEKFIKSLAQKIMEVYPLCQIDVHTIKNDFFGHSITVAGLLTGKDTVSQLKGKALGEALLIPKSMLKSGESVFLDDMKVKDMEDALGIDVMPTEIEGQDLLIQVLGIG